MDPVIVVGAGPVGLSMSLALAGQGVPCVVLDEGSGKDELRPARTVALHADTAAMVHRLGCTTLRDEGAYFTAWRTMRGGRESQRITFEDGPAPIHLPQHALTRGLRDAAAAHPLVQLVTESKIDALEQDDRGVTAHTRGAETTWWRGSHLVGCDGARSTVRKLLGIRFPGRTAVERHAVAALRTELPWPGEALLHRSPPEEVTARPLADGVYRLDWLLPARGDLVTPDALVTRIRDSLAVWCGGTTPPYELLDTGVHTLHHRLARRWRDGRCFLAGDAAHLLGALGTQGVEEGLRDAENLAWKLSLAWHQGLPRNSSTVTRPSAAGRWPPGCAPPTRPCPSCAPGAACAPTSPEPRAPPNYSWPTAIWAAARWARSRCTPRPWPSTTCPPPPSRAGPWRTSR